MSVAIIHSRAVLGVEALAVTVEIHISSGLPGFAIVGMPETAVRESKDRVRSAILNSGLEFPAKRITVNLAPADLPKTGGRYDFAIAMGILAASGQVDCRKLAGVELLGELALGGGLRKVFGMIPHRARPGAAHHLLRRQFREMTCVLRGSRRGSLSIRRPLTQDSDLARNLEEACLLLCHRAST